MSTRRALLARLSFTKALLFLLAMAGLKGISSYLPALPVGMGVTLPVALSTTAALLSLGILLWLLLQTTFEFYLAIKNLTGNLGHIVLAKLGVQTRQAPSRYISSLFDEYAPTFDEHLLKRLDYRVPEQLATFVRENTNKNAYEHVMDLGCGTGLCAPHFKPDALTLVGVDLSKNMLRQAERLNLYTRLIHGPITDVHKHYEQYFDLAIAADVLVYLGDLRPVFESVYRALKPGAVFAFSVEQCSDSDWRLTPTGRYTHADHYIEKTATECGYELVKLQRVQQRTEGDLPVPGYLVLLHKPKATQAAT